MHRGCHSTSLTSHLCSLPAQPFEIQCAGVVVGASYDRRRRSRRHHLLLSSHLISSHLGFVHPLQDVALHQCLPSSSVCCLPNPGGSLVLCYVILPSSAWSSYCYHTIIKIPCSSLLSYRRHHREYYHHRHQYCCQRNYNHHRHCHRHSYCHRRHSCCYHRHCCPQLCRLYHPVLNR